RRRKSRLNVPLDEARAVPDDAAETERRGREMLACVRALPEKYAVVLHLHYYEGCGLREIGVMLRVPAATVGTRLARGRARLKALLEEESL
ncbi:RNA polymerase sigma factor, partial [Adlercreutzia sp.]